LFKAIEKTDDEAEKKSFFLELASNLVAHDGIEREVFYPACEEAIGMDDLLGEALVEHGVIEFSLYQAYQALGQDDFDYKCKVLQELVEHHVEEEEKEFFPKVEKALGKEKLESLGEDLEGDFQEKRESDFHEPLFENLRQVLAGALKTEPEEDTSPRAKVSSKPRRTA